MRSLVKTYHIIPIALLSLLLFAAPVHAAENEELQEQQVQEAEEALQDEEQSEPNVASIEVGAYTLSLTNNTDMHTESSADSKKLLTLPFGIDLESKRKLINDNGEEWYEISYGGLSGYISAEAVNVKISDMEETQEASSKKSQSLMTEGKIVKKQAQEATESEIAESSSYASGQPEQISTTRETDIIFWLFLIIAVVLLFVAIILFFRLRHEYIRYKNRLLKSIRDRALQD